MGIGARGRFTATRRPTPWMAPRERGTAPALTSSGGAPAPAGPRDRVSARDYFW